MDSSLVHCPVVPIIAQFCPRDFKITLAVRLRGQWQRDLYVESKAIFFPQNKGLGLSFLILSKYFLIISHRNRKLPVTTSTHN